MERIAPKLNVIVTYGIPCVVFGLLVYGSWAYAYHVCWEEVYRYHSRATGIGLIVGEVLLVVVLLVTWVQIVVLGPGIQPHLPLYRLVDVKFENEDDSNNRTIPPPEVFSCDPQGFPIYCSACEGLKAERSHHSSRQAQCVPKFDHYCTWIGAVLGKRNYRLFLQFSIWFWLYFVYLGVSMACFTKIIYQRHGDTLDPNIIVLYVLAVFWLLMLFALTGSHFWYIWRNYTSIDDISARQHRRNKTLNEKFVSVLHRGERYVLRVRPDTDRLFDKGPWKNFIEVMGENPVFWLIPVGSPVRRTGNEQGTTYDEILEDYKEEYSAEWLSRCHERIKLGDYVLKFQRSCIV